MNNDGRETAGIEDELASLQARELSARFRSRLKTRLQQEDAAESLVPQAATDSINQVGLSTLALAVVASALLLFGTWSLWPTRVENPPYAGNVDFKEIRTAEFSVAESPLPTLLMMSRTIADSHDTFSNELDDQAARLLPSVPIGNFE